MILFSLSHTDLSHLQYSNKRGETVPLLFTFMNPFIIRPAAWRTQDGRGEVGFKNNFFYYMHYGYTISLLD